MDRRSARQWFVVFATGVGLTRAPILLESPDDPAPGPSPYDHAARSRGNRLPPTAGKLLVRKEGEITLGLPGTDYRIALVLDGLLDADVGERITGTIHARALRVDRITAGGRYVEPVFGRPRRVQGTIVGGDPKANAIFVAAGGATLACELTDPRQSVSDFSLHQMVTFDVKRGASFRPM